MNRGYSWLKSPVEPRTINPRRSTLDRAGGSPRAEPRLLAKPSLPESPKSPKFRSELPYERLFHPGSYFWGQTGLAGKQPHLKSHANRFATRNTKAPLGSTALRVYPALRIPVESLFRLITLTDDVSPSDVASLRYNHRNLTKVHYGPFSTAEGNSRESSVGSAFR
jgi:hypothetical protein